MQSHRSTFPESAQHVFQSMSNYDWLYHYQFFDEGFGRALRSMSRRSSGKIPFGDSLELIRVDYTAFEKEFFLFFDTLDSYVKHKIKSL